MQQPAKVQGLFGKYEPQPVSKNGGQFNRAVKSLLGSFAQARLMFNDFNKVMKNKSIARSFVRNKSFIRLKTPDGKKLGGGSRGKTRYH